MHRGLRIPSLVAAASLLTASLAGAVPPPTLRVAVFDDAVYVDTGGGANAESDTVQASLASFGFTVSTFVGVTEAAWRAGTGAVDTVVVPDLEIADLAAAMNENAEQALVDFVGRGGALIVMGDTANRQSALLNAVFGFTVATGAVAAASDLLVASGTRFIEGPATLANNNIVRAMTSFPPVAMRLYQAPGSLVTVDEASFGAGKIIFIGWDWNDAVPVGVQDGGWLEVLRRAALEGRPPTRRVAVFDNTLSVDTAGGPAAESDAIQATLVSKDMLVTTTISVGAVSLGGVLGDPRRPKQDVFLIPELENGDLAPSIDNNSAQVIRDFVAAGGMFVVCGGSESTRAAAVLNTVFSFATTGGGILGVPTVPTQGIDENTLFSQAVTSLNSPSNTTSLGGLPIGAVKLYTTDGTFNTDSPLVMIPFGEGKIFFLGWDYFNAVPLGVVDGGWLDVLDRTMRTTAPARRVALFNDQAYVEPGETILNPMFAGAEGLNLRASLFARGHVPQPFAGTTQGQWDGALATAEVLAVPELEVADVTPVLNTATREDIAAWVRRGGLMVTVVGQAGRGLNLVNAIFGTTLALSAPAGPFPATTARPGTPFALGPASLPANNGSVGVTGLPPDARAIYAAGPDAAVVWLRVGAGHVLLLGWDWFDAVSAGGAQDGGWVDALDLAVQAAAPRTRRVAVFDNPFFVDTSNNPGAESDTVQASLEFLDHPVQRFSTADGMLGVPLVLARADVVLFPELEVGDPTASFDAAAQKELRQFVAAGGTLVAHGSPSSRTANLLNSIFGWELTNPAGAPVAPFNANATGMLTTRFAGAPSTVTSFSATMRVSGLPVGSRQIYSEGGGASVVTWTPYGLGRVVYLGFDFFLSAPVGPQDGGWLELLDRAVQEARPQTRRVAFFDDPAYVDTATPGISESDDLQLALESRGQNPVPFTGVTAAAWSAGLAKAQVVVIPELEVGDLAPALPPAVRQLLRDFVARGGELIVCPDASGRSDALLSAVFGYVYTTTDTAVDPFLPTAAIPLTAGAPAQLRNLAATRSIAGGGAPSGPIYADAGLVTRAVVRGVYGAGSIVLLGWDFSGHAPYEGSDIGQTGWFDFLAHSIVTLAPPAARRVAVLDDPLYVDTGGTLSDESDTVQASLLRLEHAVAPFTGITQPAFANALARADVLLVPELEVADLTPALAPPALAEIQSFVNGGGGLVVHGTGASLRATNLINAAVGTSVGELMSVEGASTLTADTVATQFAGGPASLPENNGTSGITAGSLPLGAKAPYVNPVGKQPVATIPHGLGRAVYLGWDWFQAVPLGAVDGGWLEILDRAVREGAGGDIDFDGLANSLDLCPMIPFGIELDGDGDGVGNSCDSCENIANPRVTNGAEMFLAQNAWATLTGDQRDDDHDGYGNKCDADFTPTGVLVGSADLTQFRASNGKNRTGDTCGTIGTRPCAIFDLDEANTLIGSGDLTVFRTLSGKAAGPDGLPGPMPCSAGANGSCN